MTPRQAYAAGLEAHAEELLGTDQEHQAVAANVPPGPATPDDRSASVSFDR